MVYNVQKLRISHSDLKVKSLLFLWNALFQWKLSLVNSKCDSFIHSFTHSCFTGTGSDHLAQIQQGSMHYPLGYSQSGYASFILSSIFSELFFINFYQLVVTLLYFVIVSPWYLIRSTIVFMETNSFFKWSPHSWDLLKSPSVGPLI